MITNRYAVHAFCRYDDNDALAGEDWSGAWSHTSPTEGTSGNYIFEMSRGLTTRSTYSDIQLEAGQTYEFGFAYWDPAETATGWTDEGHYVTGGCAKNWMSLTLAAKDPGSSATKMTAISLVSAMSVAPVLITAAAFFL